MSWPVLSSLLLSSFGFIVPPIWAYEESPSILSPTEFELDLPKQLEFLKPRSCRALPEEEHNKYLNIDIKVRNPDIKCVELHVRTSDSLIWYYEVPPPVARQSVEKLCVRNDDGRIVGRVAISALFPLFGEAKSAWDKKNIQGDKRKPQYTYLTAIGLAEDGRTPLGIICSC